jgi:phosphatidylserine/phosphatidylglycerophosphate/cardiolipin synthase-like enzyme
MKRLFLILLFAATLPLAAQPDAPDLHAYFSPNGGCTDAVVNALGSARHRILVQAYSFTSAPIAKALAEAKKRGVDVRVILDKSQRTEKYSGARFLANTGIPVFIDASHRIAHNKVMVIDDETVLTGSFNFTKAAETGNAENVLLILHAPDLAAKYGDNWKEHLAHSQKYSSP